MKFLILLATIVLFLGPNAFAESCPDLSGKWGNVGSKGNFSIKQSGCSAIAIKYLLVKYSEDIKIDGVIRPVHFVPQTSGETRVDMLRAEFVDTKLVLSQWTTISDKDSTRSYFQEETYQLWDNDEGHLQAEIVTYNKEAKIYDVSFTNWRLDQ